MSNHNLCFQFFLSTSAVHSRGSDTIWLILPFHDHLCTTNFFELRNNLQRCPPSTRRTRSSTLASLSQLWVQSFSSKSGATSSPNMQNLNMQRICRNSSSLSSWHLGQAAVVQNLPSTFSMRWKMSWGKSTFMTPAKRLQLYTFRRSLCCFLILKNVSPATQLQHCVLATPLFRLDCAGHKNATGPVIQARWDMQLEDIALKCWVWMRSAWLEMGPYFGKTVPQTPGRTKNDHRKWLPEKQARPSQMAARKKARPPKSYTIQLVSVVRKKARPWKIAARKKARPSKTAARKKARKSPAVNK